MRSGLFALSQPIRARHRCGADFSRKEDGDHMGAPGAFVERIEFWGSLGAADAVAGAAWGHFLPWPFPVGARQVAIHAARLAPPAVPTQSRRQPENPTSWTGRSSQSPSLAMNVCKAA